LILGRRAGGWLTARSGLDGAAKLRRRFNQPIAEMGKRDDAGEAPAAGTTPWIGGPADHAHECEAPAAVVHNRAAGIAVAGAKARHLAAGRGVGEPQCAACGMP